MSRLLSAAVLAVGASVHAAVPAVSVSSFVQGAGVSGFADPTAATGLPSPIVGDGLGFPNILSPFSPAYEVDEIVGIGRGGQITLEFDVPLEVGGFHEFGVIGNIGLIDTSYPDGQNANPAGTFNPLPRVADVSVSENGTSFVPVGRHTFGNPANFFANASNPYLSAVPGDAVPADFGQPFTGSVADFSGLSWPQTLAALNGSGGGTWIDVDPVASGLSSFRYVRFEIPTGGIAGSDDSLYIDAVVANNAAVPEPASAVLAALGLMVFRRR